ncbi:hypothetical protein [Pseudomonas fluorescens]|uniref:hypothetical protein n=1 Tax=Pseudomonas fluorescens TaxID=294 RepID=UPI002B1E1819|nr:hypothetical protein [Pseudomonas fluorescens]
MSIEQVEGSTASDPLDPSFGNNGLAELHSPDPDYPEYAAYVVSKGPDQKIYVAGVASQGLKFMLNTLTCLNEDGSLHLGFGENGHFAGQFTESERSYLRVENIGFVNGKILLIGYHFNFFNDDLNIDKWVVCFRSNGTLDESFGKKGLFIFQAPVEDADKSANTARNQKLLESEQFRRTHPGKSGHFAGHSPDTDTDTDTATITEEHILLLHRSAHGGPFEATESYLIRINHHGQLDLTFNGLGFVRVRNETYPHLELSSVIIDKDGNYISAGNVRTNYFDYPAAIVVAKHSPDGKLDATFQEKGFLLLKDEENHFFILQKAVQQPNNRILCLGVRVKYDSDVGTGYLISREADGSSNIQFNGGRPVFITLKDSSTAWFDAVFLPDGRFLTTGLLNDGNSESDHYAVGGFLGNGVPDKNIGNGEGLIDYTEARTRSYFSSFITDNKILFLITGDGNRRFVGRGLLI